MHFYLLPESLRGTRQGDNNGHTDDRLRALGQCGQDPPHPHDHVSPDQDPTLPIGVLLRGEEGNVTCLRLFLGLRTRIRACLQEKLTAGSCG